MLMCGGPRFSKNIVYIFSTGIQEFDLILLGIRFNADDCANEEELPDFSSLGDFSLHPELQVK